jgi:CBS domain-containing protein
MCANLSPDAAILQFTRRTNMRIRDVMTPKAQTCSPSSDLAAVGTLMWRYDCGAIPVVDPVSGTVHGMITDRDICMAAATQHRPAAEIHVSDVVSGPLYAVRADNDAREALQIMRKAQVRRVPVVDSDGKLEGIVSINDLILLADAKNGGGSLLGTEVMDTLKNICAHRR